MTPVPAVIEERKRTSKAEEEMTVLQICQAVEAKAGNKQNRDDSLEGHNQKKLGRRRDDGLDRKHKPTLRLGT